MLKWSKAGRSHSQACVINWFQEPCRSLVIDTNWTQCHTMGKNTIKHLNTSACASDILPHHCWHLPLINCVHHSSDGVNKKLASKHWWQHCLALRLIWDSSPRWNKFPRLSLDRMSADWTSGCAHSCPFLAHTCSCLVSSWRRRHTLAISLMACALEPMMRWHMMLCSRSSSCRELRMLVFSSAETHTQTGSLSLSFIFGSHSHQWPYSQSAFLDGSKSEWLQGIGVKTGNNSLHVISEDHREDSKTTKCERWKLKLCWNVYTLFSPHFLQGIEA